MPACCAVAYPQLPRIRRRPWVHPPMSWTAATWAPLTLPRLCRPAPSTSTKFGRFLPRRGSDGHPCRRRQRGASYSSLSLVRGCPPLRALLELARGTCKLLRHVMRNLRQKIVLGASSLQTNVRFLRYSFSSAHSSRCNCLGSYVKEVMHEKLQLLPIFRSRIFQNNVSMAVLNSATSCFSSPSLQNILASSPFYMLEKTKNVKIGLQIVFQVTIQALT
ncbi:uncharacterized protein LOC123406107 isoform X1 [Hordeum vulgare subsp. vulgare]|uniref:uncharacterized protein LOC123406107 isoform X1 n=1 Tax=Hordeum vulgare subsp. vulgare TaxID=112509 RepID=UPI001D1A4BE5|nr:uncharacterized protein LOC123406107 isoform X1 [Hordeum vulgare subsp. vulgare]